LHLQVKAKFVIQIAVQSPPAEPRLEHPKEFTHRSTSRFENCLDCPGQESELFNLQAELAPALCCQRVQAGAPVPSPPAPLSRDPSFPQQALQRWIEGTLFD